MKRLSLIVLALVAACALPGNGSAVRSAERGNVFRCQAMGPVSGAAPTGGISSPAAIDSARTNTTQRIADMGGDTVVWDNASSASGQAFKCMQR